MNDSAFDAFTHRAAAGISRRRSLMTLGGAGVAALAGPVTAQAKKSGKKAKKKCKKKIKQKCTQQVAQCQSFLAQQGSQQLAFCCDFLSECDAGAMLQCIVNNQNNTNN